MWFKSYFSKRKAKKREIHADEQFLDALDIIKESMHIYLDLLAKAKQEENSEEIERLDAKLNTSFEYYSKSWNGDLRITHIIDSKCVLGPNNKMLRIE